MVKLRWRLLMKSAFHRHRYPDWKKPLSSNYVNMYKQNKPLNIKNIITTVLIGIILSLLIPLTADMFYTEPAFTPDNLIRINAASK
jgi:hypothetical protein